MDDGPPTAALAALAVSATVLAISFVVVADKGFVGLFGVPMMTLPLVSLACALLAWWGSRRDPATPGAAPMA